MLPISMSSSYRRVTRGPGGVLDFEMDAPHIHSLVYIGHALLSWFHLLPTMLCVFVLLSLSTSCGGSLAPSSGPCFGPGEALMLLLTLIPFSMFCGMMYVATAGVCGGGVTASPLREKWVHLVTLFNLGASLIVSAIALLTIAGWIVVYIADECQKPESNCGGSFTVIIVSAVATLVCMGCQAILSTYVIRKTGEMASDMQFLLAHTV